MQRSTGLILGAVLISRLLRPIGEEADDLTDDELDEIKSRERRIFEEDEAYARERGYLPPHPNTAPTPEPTRSKPRRR